MIRETEQTREEFLEGVEQAYRDYTETVSPEPWPIRFEMVKYIVDFLDEHPEIERVCDLGAGFSSVLFRMYDRDVRPLEVISVDDSCEWLIKAQEFSKKRGLGELGFIELSMFDTPPYFREFDLVIYDLGDFDTRKAFFWLADHLSKKFVIIDDANNTEYQKILLRRYQSEQIYPLTETLDRYRKYGWLVVKD